MDLPRLTNSSLDQLAAEYDRNNVVGFWAEPILLTGDYPKSVKDFYGNKLPAFSRAEQALLKHSSQVVTGNPYFGNKHIYGKLFIKGDPHHYSHTQTHKRTQTFVRYQHQQ